MAKPKIAYFTRESRPGPYDRQATAHLNAAVVFRPYFDHVNDTKIETGIDGAMGVAVPLAYQTLPPVAKLITDYEQSLVVKPAPAASTPSVPPTTPAATTAVAVTPVVPTPTPATEAKS